MARTRKKHMKLPNGFGSIKYLGKGRRNPYAAYPPVKEFGPHGPVTPKAVGYTATWEDAYKLLTIYHLQKNGDIVLDNTPKSTVITPDSYENPDKRIDPIIYMQHQPIIIDRSPTFKQIYEKYFHEKYEESPKKLSKSSRTSTRAAFQNCSDLHNKTFSSIRYEDLQNTLNKCTLKHSSLELMISLLKQMYRYAIKCEYIDKNHAEFLYNPKTDDDEHGEPFSPDELKIMADNRNNPIVQMLLIMCYSGFRITAYTNMEVNLEHGFFRGGVKTAAGKDRIVPIHPCILPFVRARSCDGKGNLLGVSTTTFRNEMYQTLTSLNIAYTSSGKKHTPHDCRHTFSALCEQYKVNENDRKRMLGHSFGSDITNGIYGHRSIDELKAELYKLPYLW